MSRLCGKTTNLQFIHQQSRRTIAVNWFARDAGERTLYFNFLPIEMAEVNGFKLKFGLYTVPGQVLYNATRKLVLRGADGIVFVADSQWDLMQENLESMENLKENLLAYGMNLDTLPYIFQYNKRDLPEVVASSWYSGILAQSRWRFRCRSDCANRPGVYEDRRRPWHVLSSVTWYTSSNSMAHFKRGTSRDTARFDC